MTNSLARAGGNSRLRLLALALGVLALGLILPACGGGGDDSEESAAEGTEGKEVVVFSCPDSNTFCAAYNETVTRIGSENGIDVRILVDNFDPSEQAQHINQAIAQDPDALLVVPVDSNAVVSSLARADQAGIPVITGIHRVADEGYQYVDVAVEADSAALGRFAGENIIAGLEEQGKDQANIIAITGASAQFTVDDRIGAFEETLDEQSGYDVVAVEDGNWEDEQTANIARQLFAQYEGRGGIQAAYGMADNQANAIIQAARQQGIPVGVDEPDGVIVVGSSCQPLTLRNINAGTQYGSATNSPIGEATANMNAVVDFLRGEDLPEVVPAEEEQITPDNVDEFEELCDF